MKQYSEVFNPIGLTSFESAAISGIQQKETLTISCSECFFTSLTFSEARVERRRKKHVLERDFFLKFSLRSFQFGPLYSPTLTLPLPPLSLPPLSQLTRKFKRGKASSPPLRKPFLGNRLHSSSN